MSTFLQPGAVTFMEVRHDSWCPTLASDNGDDCQCTPTMRLHNDAQYYIRTEMQNRAARRQAAREAAKACAKAARKK
jgi:hypothetical protein